MEIEKKKPAVKDREHFATKHPIHNNQNGSSFFLLLSLELDEVKSVSN